MIFAVNIKLRPYWRRRRLRSKCGHDTNSSILASKSTATNYCLPRYFRGNL